MSSRVAVRTRAKEEQGSKSSFKLKQLHGSLQKLASDQERKQKYLIELKEDIDQKSALLVHMKENLETLMRLQQSLITKYGDDQELIKRTQRELENTEARILNELYPLFNSIKHTQTEAVRTSDFCKQVGILFRNAFRKIPDLPDESSARHRLEEANSAESRFLRTKETLLQNINRLQNSLLQSGSRQNELYNQLTQLQKRHTESEKCLRQAQEELETAEDALYEKKQSRDTVSKRIADTQSTIKEVACEYEEELKKVEENEEVIQQDIQKSEEKLAGKEEAVRNIQEQHNLLEKETQKIVEIMNKAELGLSRQQDTHQRRKAALSETEEERKRLEQELFHLRKAATDELNSQHTQLQSRRNSRQRYQEQLEMQNEDLAGCYQEKQERSSTVDRLEASLSSCYQKLVDVRKEKARRDGIMTANGVSSLNSLKQLLRKEKSKATKKQKQRDSFEKKVQKAKQTIASFDQRQEQMSAVKRDVDELHHSIETVTQELNEDSDKLSKAKEQLLAMKSASQPTETTITETKELQRLHNAEIERLQSAHDKKLSKLKSCIKDTLLKIDKNGAQQIQKKKEELDGIKRQHSKSKRSILPADEDAADKEESDPMPVNTPVTTRTPAASRRRTASKKSPVCDGGSSSSDDDFIVTNLARTAKMNKKTRNSTSQAFSQKPGAKKKREEPIETPEEEVDELFLDM